MNPNLGDDPESIFLTQFLKKVFLISSLVFICLMNFVSDPVTINFLLVFVYFLCFRYGGGIVIKDSITNDSTHCSVCHLFRTLLPWLFGCLSYF